MKAFLISTIFFAFFCVGTNAQEFQAIKSGVEHLRIERKQGVDVWVINLLRVDLEKADVQVMRAMDEAVGLETASSLAQRYGAVAAINGGYFRTSGTYRGDSAGVLQVDHKLLSEPYNNRAAVGFIRKGNRTEVVFGHLSFVGFVETNRKEKRDLNGINTQRAENQLVLYTPEFTRTTLTDASGVEIIIRKNRVVSVNDRKGSSRIPVDGFVLSATGAAREWALKGLRVGTKINVKTQLIATEKETASNLQNSNGKWQMANSKLQDDKWQIQNSKWQMAEDIVGGGPQLIRDGKVEITLEQEKVSASFYETRHPRTAIAKLKDGKLLLVTVDGRQPGMSVGMSLNELAQLLLEFGAIEAINLDGGGSTTMVVENKIVNKPSDQTGERPVSDALLVFRRRAKD